MKGPVMDTAELQRRVAAMLDWLEQLALDHGGAIPSWVNAAHPGYAYPEAAGLWLSVVAQARPGSPALERTARWLSARIHVDAEGRGYVGRAGRLYTFDSAMALSGLLAARAAGVAVDEASLRGLARGLVHAVATRWPGSGVEPGSRRWSDRWACHQLKLAWALGRVRLELGPELAAEAGAALAKLEPLLQLERGGRFGLADDDGRSYVHASCYALEGALALRRFRGASDPLDAQLRRGAAWLASIQEPDGALPCWVLSEGRSPEDSALEAGRRPSDVIAQAVRLWAAVDPRAHAPAIAAGVEALARRQHPLGALSYLEPGVGTGPDASPDLNSWCTAFAVQALRTVLAAQLRAEPGIGLADPWLA
ncbi:hypothetical protein PPSIR1_39675 [Plesiocystis pacifica SIR-1]|uniref:Uncharacterized protein n=2 Tax=Plesiocystis pacifica TaxID=191768 RepID=A6FY65_9BACT|nr:hypothetical protein PPSIR1_39675 [Plesiocystis pacifica SIR-1]